MRYDLVEGLNAAYDDIEQLSTSLRRGVITLLPKGDHSLTHLRNWRPIALLIVEEKNRRKIVQVFSSLSTLRNLLTRMSGPISSQR